MIILGIILVVLGYTLGFSDLGIIGIIVLVIGAIFWSLRAISRVLVSQLGTEPHEDRMWAPAGAADHIGEPSSRSNPPLDASSQHGRSERNDVPRALVCAHLRRKPQTPGTHRKLEASNGDRAQSRRRGPTEGATRDE